MFQQLMLIGNLGGDPELRYTASGVPVASFRMAVNRRWTSADGQTQDKTTWFRVTAWRREAELANQYLSKGSKVLVMGEVEEAQAWQDREGGLRASIEVTARNIRFLDSANSNGNGNGNGVAATNGAPEAVTAEGQPADIPF